MVLDPSYGPDQRAFADAIAAFVRDHQKSWQPDPGGGASGPAFPAEAWRALAELGVLGLGAPDSGAGAVDVAAAAEALGRHGVPGPLWHTILATAVLDDAATAEAVAAGRAVVAAGAPERLPWAAEAAVLLDLTGLRAGEIWLLADVRPGAPAVMLGQERWAGVTARRDRRLPAPETAVLLADLAHAGYLVGVAERILTDAAAYARSRRQFGRPIGDFQGVALPLADCAARIAAAGALVRRAAASGDGPAGQVALASAARAARGTLYQCHQAYGAIGFTDEGPLAWLGGRVGLLATEAEAPWRRATDTALIGLVRR
ncbi:acyl-CoA dehydrogenase family protein [Dactylosporangium sp. NPDC000555]|uniref:acyl-CoA dehydrogenase family protein n=1 Tax=Dactylosporangium sp. NPDC000555 TaxID=3154260 RepID=UPI0033341776